MKRALLFMKRKKKIKKKTSVAPIEGKLPKNIKNRKPGVIKTPIEEGKNRKGAFITLLFGFSNLILLSFRPKGEI